MKKSVVNKLLSILEKEDLEKSMLFIDTNGIPKGRQSNTFNVISDIGQNYPPPFLLEIAYKQKTGEDLPKGFFDNIGMDSPHFKIIDALGFKIIKKENSMEIAEKFQIQVSKTKKDLNGDFLKAKMQVVKGGYNLLKGSYIYKEPKPSFLEHSYYGMRVQYENDGYFEECNFDDYLILKKNIAFNKPSPAAAIVLNRAANGKNEWKLEDGTTLEKFEGLINYSEYESKVYHWLMGKNEKDPDFTFSLRRKASKGTELDYFIGTEKSRYFGTTFWIIPVGFPGSSGDCIDLIFQVSKDFKNYSYNFEFTQTTNPKPGQNTFALNLIKSLEEPIRERNLISSVSSEGNSMFTIKTKSKKNKYDNLDEMLSDIDLDMQFILSLVDRAIVKEKRVNPPFKAHRISRTDFSKMKNNLNERLTKYSNIANVKINLKEKFTVWLKKKYGINSGTVSSYIKALDNISRIADLSIFELTNIEEINRWYEDAREHQKDENGKYFNEESPSYGKNGFYSASLKNYREFLTYRETMANEKSEMYNIEEMNHIPLNQILYGPPGTGKTYVTRDMSVEIANPSFEINEKRTGLNEEYKRLIKEGHILFATFHQSMSYEDFIEGIKPDFNPESSNLSYSIISGIFKRACAQAAYNCYLKANKAVTEEKNYDFDDVYDAYISKLKEHIKNKDYLICKTIQGSEVEIFHITRTASIRARAKGSEATHVAPLTKENIQKLYDRFASIDEIENLHEVKETVEVSPRITEFYAVFKSLKEFEKEFSISSEASEVKSLVGLSQSEILKKFEAGVFNSAASKFGGMAQPVVLIIDEINRGNVSGIFGELITLLEEDKRIGTANELSVLLPYSQKEFYVPQNLYLIGTMNTADRSVEALDTALRRRFSFVEMMPDYEVISNLSIEGIDLKQLLRTINERIELLVDRDHTIGHSYFIDIKNPEKLANAFNDKIIPLLQEYFYGDYGKIGLVLGEGFVEKTETTDIVFAKFKYDDSEDFKTPKYNLIKANESNIISSLKILLGQVEEPSVI